MKKIIISVTTILLLSFTYSNNNKENLSEAIRVQNILIEELEYIYKKDGTLVNKSNLVDAKYVLQNLNKITI
tara:strand:- start:62 stop:277 length:216 start_codon:yes stop_codon:yes gene_type:complete